MTKVHDEVLAANATYAKTFGDKAKLAMPPARRFAILTCMDAASPKATRMSSATPAAAPATTPSARWSSRTSCSAPKSGS